MVGAIQRGSLVTYMLAKLTSGEAQTRVPHLYTNYRTMCFMMQG